MKLLKGEIDHRELAELVHISRSIIENYLRYFRQSVVRLSLHQGLTISDLAYDCIAETFSKDENDNYQKLINFSKALNNDLTQLPEIEIFLAYKSFLTCLADAQLARLYAQSDPAGAKIHRNIRDTIKNSDSLLIVKDYRGLVVKLKDNPAERLNEFPQEEFEREFMINVDHQRTIPELLNVCREILVGQNKYRTSISLVDVVQIFRKIYQSDHTLIEEEDVFASEGLTKFEIEQLCSEVLLFLKEKIFLTYLARGKVDRKSAEAIYTAFRDMLEDWCYGEESKSSIFEYLKVHIQIDDNQYEEIYRTKMEYLLKIAREEFAARLMREL
ncbi:MAG: hypothetical protein HY964_06460 [Ignavibacteriales bacterium]|nr:hypothetical protein [Ignavibacteriales bacterium]